MFKQSKNRLPAIAAAAVIGTFMVTGGAWAQMDSLSIMAPASPGGGWDGTARAMQQALQKEGIVENVDVTNDPGAGGTIGLAQFAGSSGPGDRLMVSGLVMFGAVLNNKKIGRAACRVELGRDG